MYKKKLFSYNYFKNFFVIYFFFYFKCLFFKMFTFIFKFYFYQVLNFLIIFYFNIFLIFYYLKFQLDVYNFFVLRFFYFKESVFILKNSEQNALNHIKKVFNSKKRILLLQQPFIFQLYFINSRFLIIQQLRIYDLIFFNLTTGAFSQLNFYWNLSKFIIIPFFNFYFSYVTPFAYYFLFLHLSSSLFSYYHTFVTNFLFKYNKFRHYLLINSYIFRLTAHKAKFFFAYLTYTSYSFVILVRFLMDLFFTHFIFIFTLNSRAIPFTLSHLTFSSFLIRFSSKFKICFQDFQSFFFSKAVRKKLPFYLAIHHLYFHADSPKFYIARRYTIKKFYDLWFNLSLNQFLPYLYSLKFFFIIKKKFFFNLYFNFLFTKFTVFFLFFHYTYLWDCFTFTNFFRPFFFLSFYKKKYTDYDITTNLHFNFNFKKTIDFFTIFHSNSITVPALLHQFRKFSRSFEYKKRLHVLKLFHYRFYYSFFSDQFRFFKFFIGNMLYFLYHYFFQIFWNICSMDLYCSKFYKILCFSYLLINTPLQSYFYFNVLKGYIFNRIVFLRLQSNNINFSENLLLFFFKKNTFFSWLSNFKNFYFAFFFFFNSFFFNKFLFKIQFLFFKHQRKSNFFFLCSDYTQLNTFVKTKPSSIFWETNDIIKFLTEKLLTEKRNIWKI